MLLRSSIEYNEHINRCCTHSNGESTGGASTTKPKTSQWQKASKFLVCSFVFVLKFASSSCSFLNTPRVTTPPMHTPDQWRTPTPQTTSFEGPKSIETLRAAEFVHSVATAISSRHAVLWNKGPRSSEKKASPAAAAAFGRRAFSVPRWT